ncbi:MAG: ATP-binding protein, partial [Planctomycetota bacterium]
MSAVYDSSAIEVLTGLEPVRKRPGMYTQTERPNHLVQEVVDNSVDEAIAGHASVIQVVLHDDDSATVADNGRGMPVDLHREEKVTGVEVIMTRLHAGGKFSNKNYRFSGGLHGVGVSVVNALSKHLELWVRRDGREFNMAFADGQKRSELEEVGSIAKKLTGTVIRFWPDEQFFDTVKFHVPRLKRLLRAKAVLCPGLLISFRDQTDPDNDEDWQFEDGLVEYLDSQLEDGEQVPEPPFTAHVQGSDEEADWVVVWLPEAGQEIAESYVNLIPTPQGGTHVNGFRSGLTDAIREFCEFRDLLPRGVKLSPEDVWSRCNYVLSVRLRDPQFTGQTKDRLSSRETAVFMAGVAKDEFSLWLNQHIGIGERIARLAIENAQARLRA